MFKEADPKRKRSESVLRHSQELDQVVGVSGRYGVRSGVSEGAATFR